MDETAFYSGNCLLTRVQRIDAFSDEPSKQPEHVKTIGRCYSSCSSSIVDEVAEAYRWEFVVQDNCSVCPTKHFTAFPWVR
uniref:DUF2790 domain-containing protein n=1 Tax=Ascaris lumbricoides TaxID=6252 RepID=A0A0M3HMX9_ASCLU